MKRLGVIIVIMQLYCHWSMCATWYVRPLPGPYGSHDGTSYSNAWTGITNIAWGSVTTGDTIYLCGTNIYTITGVNQFYNKGISSLTVSGITFRGDYPNDMYVGFGGALDTFQSIYWDGPDANGIYSTTNYVYGASTGILLYEVDGVAITYLPIHTNTTWTDGPGSYFDGVTNWIRTVSGNAPSNNIALALGGFIFNFNNQSNIVFNSCTFISQAFQENGTGFYGTLAQGYSNAVNHITFNNCTFPSNGQWTLASGQDYWTFSGCEIGFSEYGVYGFSTLTGARGPSFVTITNCYLHDTVVYRGQVKDLHAIGMQASCNDVIIGNTILRSAGTAVDFFSNGLPLTNNTIAFNFIMDTSGTINSGTGIAFDSALSTTPGLQAGNRIYGNIIEHAGINASYGRNGIGLNISEHVFVCNNVISYCENGISVNAGTYPVSGTFENNIIVNPTNSFLVLSGTGTTNTCVVDYNLFWSNTVPTQPFSISPNFTHDTHSKFADPIFSITPETTATDFKILQGSPAINSGIDVGLTRDFSGSPIQGIPDIGAFEWQPPTATIGTATFY